MATDPPADLPQSPFTRPAGPTPAWVVQAFTFLNSIGTALVTNGVFYITESGFKFTRTQNFWLAFWMGISYVASAYTTRPVVQVLRDKLGLSSRGVLALLMTLLGTLCLVPLGLQHLPLSEETGRAVQLVGVWFTVITYNMLTGILWPVVESYIAGGRRGADLRSTMGFWNVCWASAAVPATFILAPLVRERPAEAIAIMATVHALCGGLLAWHTVEPVPHVDEHTPHPPVYERLLVAFRMLMPMGYTVMTTLTPMLVVMFKGQGIKAEHAPYFGLAWIVPRIACFAILGSWGGWHGRWWTPIFGAVLIVAGFGAVVLSTLAGPGTALVFMLGGLGLFGFGMATIYTGAIYYAMEVHKSDVDAGGTHETLVGLGYTTGPACGLLATWFAGSGGAGPSNSFGPTLFAIVGGLAVVWTCIVIAKVRTLAAHARTPNVR